MELIGSAGYHGFAIGCGNELAWNGVIWVGVGYDSDQGANQSILWIGDITTENWTNVNNLLNYLHIGYGVTWGASKFVAVGKKGSNTSPVATSIAYSADGNIWYNSSNDPFSGGTGYGIEYNGIMFVAVGNGTYSIAYSCDGINWTVVLSLINIMTTRNKVAWTGKK